MSLPCSHTRAGQDDQQPHSDPSSEDEHAVNRTSVGIGRRTTCCTPRTQRSALTVASHSFSSRRHCKRRRLSLPAKDRDLLPRWTSDATHEGSLATAEADGVVNAVMPENVSREVVWQTRQVLDLDCKRVPGVGASGGPSWGTRVPVGAQSRLTRPAAWRGVIAIAMRLHADIPRIRFFFWRRLIGCSATCNVKRECNK